MSLSLKLKGKRWFKIVLIAVCALIFIGVVAGIVAYSFLRASLSIVEGEVAVSGLSAPVTVERDSFGIPIIRGKNRVDVFREPDQVRVST